MKWFGKRREASRPALARAHGGAAMLGEWPQSYEAQVREGYCVNPVAQRAVKIVCEGVADARSRRRTRRCWHWRRLGRRDRS